MLVSGEVLRYREWRRSGCELRHGVEDGTYSRRATEEVYEECGISA